MKDNKKLVKEFIYNTCRVCLQKILSCSEFLSNHIRLLHKMTLNEYRKQFNCHSSVTTACEKLLLNGRLSKLQIGNMCTFKCPECKQSFSSVMRFYYHSSKTRKQGCPFKSSRSSWYLYIDKIVTHKCQICSKLLLCDKKFIRSHSYHIHGFRTLEDYSKHSGSI